MKYLLRFFFATLLLCSAITLPTYAQKRKVRSTRPSTPDSITLAKQTEAIATAIADYRFTEAEHLLQAALKQAQTYKWPITQIESQLTSVRRAATMLQATSRVAIIDSFVVDRQAAISAIKLSQHSGQILTMQQLSKLTGMSEESQSESSAYTNEFADRIVYPKLNTTIGTLQLAQSDFVGGQWQAPQYLQGLPTDGYQQNYPFIMPDGVTIYYAAQGEESLGGYDIFVSRYNRESKHYFLPENLGMPFNSPANDYLYAIDEVNKLGWFVSDRYQPTDKACVYVFVPFTHRELAADSLEDEEMLRTYASLRTISITQADSAIIQQGKARLALCLQQPVTSSSSKNTETFTFDLNDTHTYTTLTQFRSAQARQQMQTWLKLTTQIQKLEKQLEQWYASPSVTPEQIVQAEAQLLQFNSQKQQLQKNIRALELAQ